MCLIALSTSGLALSISPYIKCTTACACNVSGWSGSLSSIRSITISASSRLPPLIASDICNYDGYFKYKTTIGERAFIGSNSALVAPVTIGADAIVAAGSTVTRDVAPGELRMERAEQSIKPGWADRFHDTMKKKRGETK